MDLNPANFTHFIDATLTTGAKGAVTLLNMEPCESCGAPCCNDAETSANIYGLSKEALRRNGLIELTEVPNYLMVDFGDETGEERWGCDKCW